MGNLASETKRALPTAINRQFQCPFLITAPLGQVLGVLIYRFRYTIAIPDYSQVGQLSIEKRLTWKESNSRPICATSEFVEEANYLLDGVGKLLCSPHHLQMNRHLEFGPSTQWCAPVGDFPHCQTLDSMYALSALDPW